jgi:hypothetical protein
VTAKKSNLKKAALALVAPTKQHGHEIPICFNEGALAIIRRALKALPDD